LVSLYSNPAYDEGFRSYKKHKGEYLNPYMAGTEKHNIFERGWSQALKRYPGLYEHKRERRASLDRCTVMEEDKDLKKAKDHYLKSKG
jgi:hypothetical protein